MEKGDKAVLKEDIKLMMNNNLSLTIDTAAILTFQRMHNGFYCFNVTVLKCFSPLKTVTTGIILAEDEFKILDKPVWNVPEDNSPDPINRLTTKREQLQVLDNIAQFLKNNNHGEGKEERG